MGISFKREATMRFFQEIAFLLLPLLVVGQFFEDPLANRDGRVMDTSEKWECYVFGQCEEYSVNFEKITSAESCHKFCGKNDDCKWWTWEHENLLCSLFANCTDPKQSTGHPNAGACSDCISGQQACPGREFHSADKCQGHVVQGEISNKATHLEDCINICKDTVDCEYYTYDKKNDHCVIFKDCNSTISCDTCATGKKYCSNGYHGDEEEVTDAVTEVITDENPVAPANTNWGTGCEEKYKCRDNGIHRADNPTYEASLMECIWRCKGTPSCKFYTWEVTKNYILCNTYKNCDMRDDCSECKSGSLAHCSG